MTMQFNMLKSKIHRATITEADLNYEGSLTIDKELLEAVDLHPYEQVKVYNINNGERFDTYVIEGKPGTGVIGLNGAAARKGLVGDQIIIVSYALFSEKDITDYQPKIVLLNKSNQIKKWLHK
jgi:aspartate 1-decarboxylase